LQQEFAEGSAAPIQEFAEGTPTPIQELHEEDLYFDAEEFENFEQAVSNKEVNLDDMAYNYFARADEIHRSFVDEQDASLHFDDLSSEEDEADQSNLMEEILREAGEPLFRDSTTSRLQFSIILMSLTTLYGVSHHCLDEILTFLKHDILPMDNTCPRNSYEMKSLLMKLGLSHEVIHCCDCGKTLYWKDKAALDTCPECQSSRYIDGSKQFPYEF